MRANLPPAPDNLQKDCYDPGLSGDKGTDAINHRVALGDCSGEVEGWQKFYKDVVITYGEGPAGLVNKTVGVSR